MNIGAFERGHPLGTCTLSLIVWLGLSGAALWPFTRAKLIDRLPFVLCIGSIFLSGVLYDLPRAFSRIFEAVIQHSIYAIETTKDRSGTLFSEPWIEAWQDGGDVVIIWLTLIGALWGLVNLVRRRAWISNALAVVYTIGAVLWALTHASPI